MSSKKGGCLGSILFVILSGQLGCIGTLIALVVMAAVVYGLAVSMYYIVRALLIVGAVVGLGITLRNYVLALYHNIKPERVTP